MKLEQLIIWLIVAAAVCFALRAFFEAYDEVEITYDPTTGRQSVKGRKNRALEGPTPLTLEGEQVVMRVRDLPGWVPQPGGARSTGERVPRPNEVFIERVLQVFNDNLIFTCRFVDNFSGKPEGRSVFYSFPVLEKETLPKIAEIINQNVGKTLLSIGDIEIPSD